MPGSRSRRSACILLHRERDGAREVLLVHPGGPFWAKKDEGAWSIPKGGGYMCTPLVYRGLVYIVKYNGVTSVYDAKTGDVKFQQRLAGGTTVARGMSPCG